MKTLDKKGLEALRAEMKRPYGGVTTFLPTEEQTGLIRMSLLKNFDDMVERGYGIWLDTHKSVRPHASSKETCIPILIKNRTKEWMFLTHHILDKSQIDVRRGESDVLVEHKGGLRKYVNSDGDEITPEHYTFNNLGELVGGKWSAPRMR